MKRYTPVRKRRSKPRRVLGREKLYGKAKEARRREIFERSRGRCEEIRALYYAGHILAPFGSQVGEKRCNNPITWESMEWSHNRHGANKDDSLSGGIASCKECHQRRHNPKPNPKKVA